MIGVVFFDPASRKGLQLGSDKFTGISAGWGGGIEYFAPFVGVAMNHFGKTNGVGGTHFFWNIFGGQHFYVPFLRTFFENPFFLPIFKVNCGNDIVSAVWY